MNRTRSKRLLKASNLFLKVVPQLMTRDSSSSRLKGSWLCLTWNALCFRTVVGEREKQGIRLNCFTTQWNRYSSDIQESLDVWMVITFPLKLNCGINEDSRKRRTAWFGDAVHSVEFVWARVGVNQHWLKKREWWRQCLSATSPAWSVTWGCTRMHCHRLSRQAVVYLALLWVKTTRPHALVSLPQPREKEGEGAILNCYTRRLRP